MGVLESEHRVSHKLGKGFVAELDSQPTTPFILRHQFSFKVQKS